MASAEQLKALLRSHLEGNDDQFISVAMQVAAHEARLGHGKLATDLRDIIDQAKSRREAGISGADQPAARRVGQPPGGFLPQVTAGGHDPWRDPRGSDQTCYS